MTEMSKLTLAKTMLAEHLDAGIPSDETHVGDIDLVAVDESICTLVELIVRFEGNLEELNEYCKKSGLQDFSTMVHEAQSVLEATIPQLPTVELKHHFARLGRMTIVIAELAMSQADTNPGLEEKSFNMLQTADLDMELLEFRKMAARQKLKKEGRFGPL